MKRLMYAIVVLSVVISNPVHAGIAVTNVQIFLGELANDGYHRLDEADQIIVGDIFDIGIEVTNNGNTTETVFNTYSSSWSPSENLEVVGQIRFGVYPIELEPGESVLLSGELGLGFEAKEAGLVTMDVTVHSFNLGSSCDCQFTFEIESLYSLTAPTTKTEPAKLIDQKSAALKGVINEDGNPEGTEDCETCFEYWKIENPFTGNAGASSFTPWQCCFSDGESFSKTISVEPNSVYGFRALARNSQGQSQGEIKSFSTFWKDTLLIRNFIKAFTENQQGIFTFMQKQGNLAGYDPKSDDILFQNFNGKASKIISLVSKSEPNENAAGFYELSRDARNAPDPNNWNDPNGKSLIELSIYGSDPNFYDSYSEVNSENYIEFWLPDSSESFKGKHLTIQQVSIDANIVYPVWDVNQIITKNNIKLPLGNLVNQTLNVPYAWFTLSTSREILDISNDGVIDFNDYLLLLTDLGKEGIFRSDISSLKNNNIILGLPDGNVNDTDEIAFITEYNKKYPANPLPNPHGEFSEGFETGDLRSADWVSSGNAKWIISSNSFSGRYSAKAGQIEDDEESLLRLTLECHEGEISFYYKISSEQWYDCLEFYIDGSMKGQWSGEVNWTKVTFPVTEGTRTFKWVYKKDGSVSHGEDSAWIDDIIFPGVP